MGKTKEDVYTLDKYIDALEGLKRSHGGDIPVYTRGVGGEFPTPVPEYRSEKGQNERVIIDDWS